MDSSDDEAEALPLSVSNYHFMDDKDEPVSFSALPIQWSEGERLDDKTVQVFLHGTADNGLQKIYKPVIAWKFDLSNVKPEISVLSKENSWIKLQKPRKSFEEIIRSTLITVHCLHCVMRNPEASGKPLWDQIFKNFSSFEVRPSERDLVASLISEAIKRHDALTKSKFLEQFLKEKPEKRKRQDEDSKATTMSTFIVNDSDDDMDDVEEDESNEDDELFDSVCSFCDNGGDLLCCEGSCLRSFHATEQAGEESLCVSLGYSQEEVEAIQQFLCKNCEYKQHQCFVCGKLGSSNKYSGAEVFCCVSATCGRFYHPSCVAKLLHADNEASSKDLEKKIAKGESFTCPVHKCSVCKKGENKKDCDLQLAICRRCPKSYHRKCLPRKISFEDNEEEGIITRAWEDLLPNRILIYCLKHAIDEELGTPHRNHIKFPGVEEKKSTLGKRKTIVEEKRQKKAYELIGDRKKIVSKVRVLPPEESQQGKMASAAPKQSKPSSALKVGGRTTAGKLSAGSSIPRKAKVNDATKKETKSPGAEEGKALLGDRFFAYMHPPESGNLGKQDTIKHTSSGQPILKPDSEKRLLDLIENVESSITIKDIREKHKVPTTHERSLKNYVESSCTQGKVDAAVVAVKAALRELEAGGRIEDAEAVCAPDFLGQIFKWKNKLKVYLSPFLYGMRYTSFGRHFTKVEKLEQIVNKLHWYVQEGDTIVDFCCGANDFSLLMKKKLDETGKRCSYKNYDFIPPKNDFNFEQRDWMTVQQDELPNGSKLIMGLNPPFGVKAALATKFIDKALQFKPKLLILIVPPETQRLDEKKLPYVLVWEDDHFLSGKSFYLPGSVDVKDKQMEQWNVRPPVLSLWSHPDWSAKHREIAESHEHTSGQQEAIEESRSELIPDNLMDNHDDGDIPDHSMGDHDDHVEIDIPDYPTHVLDDKGDNHMLSEDPVEIDNSKDPVSGVVGSDKESSLLTSTEKESRGSHEQGKKASGEKSSKISRNAKRKKKRRANRKISADIKQDGRSPVREIPGGDGRSPSAREIRGGDGRSPPVREFHAGDRSSPLVRESHARISPRTDIIENSNPQFDSSMPHSHPDEVNRKYVNDGERHHPRYSNGWPSKTGYGVRSFDDQHYTGQMRNNIGSFGSSQLPMEVMPRREPDIRPHFRIGSQYPVSQDPRCGHFGSHASVPSPYAPPLVEPSCRANPVGMQWRAPRLDELPHPRMGAFAGEVPPRFGGNGVFSPRPPHHGYPGGPMPFIPGPRPPYPRPNSGGWLND